MNRIYQGRVTKVEVPDGKDEDGKQKWKPRSDCDWQSALWRHHELFQDAVNYYTVAIPSLGFTDQSRLTALRRLFADAWEEVEKQGERRDGLCQSFKRIMGMDAPPALADVVKWFVEPLDKAGVEPRARELAGESLLHDLGGPGSIQQGGEYWPYFCQSGFERGVQFPRAAAQLLKERTKEKLPTLLRHTRISLHTKLMQRVLRTEMFANVDKNDPILDAEESSNQLKNAVEFFQLTDQGAAISGRKHTVSKIVGSSINKTPLKARFYAFLIFKHLAGDAVSLARLADCYPLPKKNKTAKRKEPNEKDLIEKRLCSLGIDPIEAVRQKSGIVIRAFTALPMWQRLSAGQNRKPPGHERSNFAAEIAADTISRIGWKEFDVAAFKEALTVINQFNQNVTQREKKLNELATKLLVMDGERVVQEYNCDGETDRKIRARLEEIWADSKGKPKLPQPDEETDGEAITLPILSGDTRIDRLREIVSKDLAEEYRLTEGRTTPYGLRRRTMKGWAEVKRKWQGIVKAGVSYSEEKKGELQAALNDLRKTKSEQIGSHRLFEALIANEASWRIWQEPTDEEAEKIASNGWAVDPLESFRIYCETRETLEDISQRPLNFTPADGRRSRRLFGFKEVCSFGREGGEFKHDISAMAVTVPIVCNNNHGVFEKTTVRLSYGAPRLLRDQIRDAEGRYIQKWIQPMVAALCPEQTQLPPQQLADAAVELMPDWNKDEKLRFLLNFSFDLQPIAIAGLLPQNKIWDTTVSGPEIKRRFNQDEIRIRQFVAWDKGEVLTFLRWQSELLQHLTSCLGAMKKYRTWKANEAGVDNALAAFSAAATDEDRARVLRKLIDATSTQGETDKDKKLRRSLEYGLLSLKQAWWRHETLNSFRILSADLGIRHGATIARVEASSSQPVQPSTARFIGEAGGRAWYARYLGGRILRLPGEDAKVVRHQTEQDLARDPEGEAKLADKHFREELHGDRGRLADREETSAFLKMLHNLGQAELLPEALRTENKLADLQKQFSFPEQNDKLLIAIRFTQGHLADMISQHWRLVKPEKATQTDDALQELKEQDHYPEVRAMAGDPSRRDELVKFLNDRIGQFRELVQKHLLTLTERILPMRGRAWKFDWHDDTKNFRDCHVLRSVAQETVCNKWIRGQRGISMARIEQLSELRRRWQSLNQSMRRKIGERPLTAAEMRAKPIPDPCPTILRKLEEIRDQRTNQIAHQILAEALALELRLPQKDKKERQAADIHGEYKRASGKTPVDFIVLEHLARYKANQGRAKSENTRLMQWCHRAVVAKIKELAETFGIPVLETPAAYSSRFCSLTGVAGFRAAEVSLADRDEYRWQKLLKEAEEKGDTASPDAKTAAKLFRLLEEANRGRIGKEKLTLLAPQIGGPIFVTAVDVPHPAPNPKRLKRKEGQQSLLVAPIQADLNAAVNLAFRAISHPDCADIHHRIRSKRIAEDIYLTQERRRFGENQPKIIRKDNNPLPKERNPNIFYDAHGTAQFDRVRLESEAAGQFPYATGRGLWKRLNDPDFQWDRCTALNKERLENWGIQLSTVRTEENDVQK